MPSQSLGIISTLQSSLVFGFFLSSFTVPELVSAYRHQPESPPSVQIHNESFQPDKILRITAVNYSIDCKTRYSVVVNGSVPGPELRFREGDKVWIRVYNDMDEERFTMHWHGLTMRMSPFSDGTPAASQWPIPPRHYFDYEFQLQPGDAGTYYYHSHVGFGAITAFGALIVEEPEAVKPPFDYDEDRTLLFSDVFHASDSSIVRGLLGNPFQWSGESNNIALNGHSRFINATSDQAGQSCSFGVISVKPDRVYRFRLVGATAISQVFVGFEGHGSGNVTLIEVDGSYISPTETAHVQVHTGQRYSVLFRSKSSTELSEDRKIGKNQYWIQIETRSRPIIVTTYGVLAYEDAQVPPDAFTVPLTKPLLLSNETFPNGWSLEDELKPLPSHPYEDTLPQLSEVTRRVIVNIQQVVNGYIHWAQQRTPWYEHTPKEPYLVSLYKDSTQHFPNYTAALDNGGLCPITKTFPAKIGEVLEIVLQNTGNSLAGVLETHPFHAHGDHYWDIGSGYGAYDVSVAEAILRKKIRNGGPIKRDTTNLYRTPLPQTTKPGDIGSWRAWRVRVKSPGVWMIHCHVLQHMVMGMQTVWVFGEADDLKYLPEHLTKGYLEYGGNAYGNDTHDPSVLHYWHD